MSTERPQHGLLASACHYEHRLPERGLRARPSTTELLAAVATELDVEVHELGREATTRRVLDPEEREGLVVELADALGVAHAGVEGYDLGTLSIDPTEGLDR